MQSTDANPASATYVKFVKFVESYAYQILATTTIKEGKLEQTAIEVSRT